MPEELTWSEEDGLRISYDEESGLLSFEWDEKTHPQYDCLRDLTTEKFQQILEEYCELLDNANEKTTDIQNRRPSCGKTESNRDSEPLA